MKAKEIAKYMSYADNDEDYIVLKRKDLYKIMALVKKYIQIKKIMFDKSNSI